MRPELESKLGRLREVLSGLGSVAVAFSGGVDSTLLLKVASDTLGGNVLAVTAKSETYQAEELEESRRMARELGVRHVVIETGELALPGFSDNTPRRCYHCKRELFTRMRAVCEAEGIRHIAHGANADDAGDFRPGLRAARELGVHGPLREAGLSKAEIRELSAAFGLKTASKPAMACLASRFPYHTRITREALKQVAAAERELRSRGFELCRVRHHGGLARIEVAPEEVHRFTDGKLRNEVHEALRALGYTWVTLDLAGYRAGSMNESLSDGERTRALEGGDV